MKVNSVYGKIAAIASHGASEKTGKMTAVGKYNYHTIDGVFDHLRPLLAEHGLVVTYDVTSADESRDGGYFNLTKWIEVTITDVETGDQVSGREIAVGIDKNDKASGKATSYALKTFLVGTFALKGMPDENTQPIVPGQQVPDVNLQSSGPISASQAGQLSSKVKALGIDKSKLLAFAGCDSIEALPSDKYTEVMAIIAKRESTLKGASK